MRLPRPPSAGAFGICGATQSGDFPATDTASRHYNHPWTFLVVLDYAGAPAWGHIMPDGAGAGLTAGDDGAFLLLYLPLPSYYGAVASAYGPFRVVKLDREGTSAWTREFDGVPDAAALDANGDVYVGGHRFADNVDPHDYPDALYPSWDNAFESGLDYGDGFLTKILADGTIAYWTYVGHHGDDVVRCVEPGPDGSVYIAGATGSADAEHPETWGTNYGGDLEAFAAKFDATGQPEWFRFLGGSGDDEVLALDVADTDAVVIAGRTRSVDLPCTVGTDAWFGGGRTEGFYAVIDADGVSQTGYIGGAGEETCAWIACAPDGAIEIAGMTTSGDFAVRGAFQPEYGGGRDLYVMAVGAGVEPFVIYAPDDGAYLGQDTPPVFEFAMDARVTAAWAVFSTEGIGDPAAVRFSISPGTSSWTPTGSQWQQICDAAGGTGRLRWWLEGDFAGRVCASAPRQIVVTPFTDAVVSNAHDLGGVPAVWPNEAPVFAWTKLGETPSAAFVEISAPQDLDNTRRSVTVSTGGALSVTPSDAQWSEIKSTAAACGGTLYWRVTTKRLRGGAAYCGAWQALAIDPGAWAVEPLDLSASRAVAWTHVAQGYAKYFVEFSASDDFSAKKGKSLSLPSGGVAGAPYMLTTADRKALYSMAARAGQTWLYWRVRAEDSGAAFYTYSPVETVELP